MPVRAGEHSGWLGAGSLGSVAPGILMMKVISRNFFFFWIGCPRGGGITVCGGAESDHPRAGRSAPLLLMGPVCTRAEYDGIWVFSTPPRKVCSSKSLAQMSVAHFFETVGYRVLYEL